MRSRPLVVAVLLGAVVAGGVVTAAGQALRVGQPAPDVAGEAWINSPPLTMTGLRGRVVLVWSSGRTADTTAKT